ncbi:MAG TPA: DUF6194 family protein [Candidatus Dormibacteraeota bacterium]|nr:DUF6194 family protein [Candidatus Dormibacteraeota bacterium]
MDQGTITRYIASEFASVDVVVASRENGAPEVSWGDMFFIYERDAHRFPFATIVTHDYGDFDNASHLDRPGVFRLNIGVSKETYQSLFAGEGRHDFTALDRVMPHPVYGRNHWVCVLNPSDATFHSVRPLLEEAYQIAVDRTGRRKIRADERTRT